MSELLFRDAFDDVIIGVVAEGLDQHLLGNRLAVRCEEDFLLAGEVAAGEVDGDGAGELGERLTDARFASASHDARHGDGVVVLGLDGGR